jgi:hypothetical protein
MMFEKGKWRRKEKPMVFWRDDEKNNMQLAAGSAEKDLLDPFCRNPHAIVAAVANLKRISPWKGEQRTKREERTKKSKKHRWRAGRPKEKIERELPPRKAAKSPAIPAERAATEEGGQVASHSSGPAFPQPNPTQPNPRRIEVRKRIRRRNKDNATTLRKSRSVWCVEWKEGESRRMPATQTLECNIEDLAPEAAFS